MTAIGLTDLVFERRDFRLGPITADFPAGSRTALVGPSGAGKSTLLRCVAGLETPTSGDVRFGGVSVTAGPRGPLPPDRRGIGYLFQHRALWPHMTGVDHLRFVAPRLGRDGALALLDRVGLGADLAQRRPDALSGGEAQRLALARALAQKPPVLLLDEPLSSVDAHLCSDLALLVRDLADERGLTLLVVTHDRDEALAMADRLAVLSAGRLIEQGAAIDLLRSPATAPTAAFLGRATCFPASPGANGTLRTSFGDIPRPEGAGPWSLVLLPGDLIPTEGTGVSARVLRCEPEAAGYRIHAVLDGRGVELSAREALPPGSEVRVALRDAPRVLPERVPETP